MARKQIKEVGTFGETKPAEQSEPHISSPMMTQEDQNREMIKRIRKDLGVENIFIFPENVDGRNSLIVDFGDYRNSPEESAVYAFVEPDNDESFTLRLFVATEDEKRELDIADNTGLAYEEMIDGLKQIAEAIITNLQNKKDEEGNAINPLRECFMRRANILTEGDLPHREKPKQHFSGISHEPDVFDPEQDLAPEMVPEKPDPNETEAHKIERMGMPKLDPEPPKVDPAKVQSLLAKLRAQGKIKEASMMESLLLEDDDAVERNTPWPKDPEELDRLIRKLKKPEPIPGATHEWDTEKGQWITKYHEKPTAKPLSPKEKMGMSEPEAETPPMSPEDKSSLMAKYRAKKSKGEIGEYASAFDEDALYNPETKKKIKDNDMKKLNEDKWAQGAFAHAHGQLHQALGYDKDEKIPTSVIDGELAKLHAKEQKEGHLSGGDLHLFHMLQAAKNIREDVQGGGTEQKRSYRTIDDAPQRPYWDQPGEDEMRVVYEDDEGEEEKEKQQEPAKEKSKYKQKMIKYVRGGKEVEVPYVSKDKNNKDKIDEANEDYYPHQDRPEKLPLQRIMGKLTPKQEPLKIHKDPRSLKLTLEPEEEPTKEKETEGMYESAPPGWEDAVKAMKTHPKIKNPWALAWSMKNKGYNPHKIKEMIEDDIMAGVKGRKETLKENIQKTKYPIHELKQKLSALQNILDKK